jgi:acetyl-CoA acyltransferase
LRCAPTSGRRAIDEGRFANEIEPLESRVHPDVPGAADVTGLMEVDEGVRRVTSLEKLAGLRPAFFEGEAVTAGSSSQISDGAAAVLIMSVEKAAALGLRPRARFHTNDPQIMLTAPIPATTMVFAKSKLRLDDIDLIEINEAFASVVLAWEDEFHPDPERVNVNGGAIAIGHPTGCSGARLMATLLNELERSGGRFGLQAMCEGGGQANATIIERLDA